MVFAILARDHHLTGGAVFVLSDSLDRALYGGLVRKEASPNNLLEGLTYSGLYLYLRLFTALHADGLRHVACTHRRTTSRVVLHEGNEVRFHSEDLRGRRQHVLCLVPRNVVSDPALGVGHTNGLIPGNGLAVLPLDLVWEDNVADSSFGRVNVLHLPRLLVEHPDVRLAVLDLHARSEVGVHTRVGLGGEHGIKEAQMARVDRSVRLGYLVRILNATRTRDGDQASV